MARYAVESGKQIAAGLINLGDVGYRTLSKYCHELLPDVSNSALSPTSSRNGSRVLSPVHPIESDNAGMVCFRQIDDCLFVFVLFDLLK